MTMNGERGAALVIALMVVCFAAAVATSMAVLSTTELKIAASFAEAAEVRSVAEAALEIVVQELTGSSDWNAIVTGPAISAFSDGFPTGRRTLADGSHIDLDQLSTQVLDGNHTFRLFAFGPAARIQPPHEVVAAGYAVVWIGNDLDNPGLLAIRADAFGSSGVRRILAARLARTDSGGARIASWQEVR